jgi:hypothetical protein
MIPLMVLVLAETGLYWTKDFETVELKGLDYVAGFTGTAVVGLFT